jgi:hypothetical protein
MGLLASVDGDAAATQLVLSKRLSAHSIRDMRNSVFPSIAFDESLNLAWT